MHFNLQNRDYILVYLVELYTRLAAGSPLRRSSRVLLLSSMMSSSHSWCPLA